MPSELQPGDRVRVARGMYAGTVGVVSHLVPASPGTYAVVRSGSETIAAYVSALERVTEPTTLRAGVEALYQAALARLAQLEAMPQGDALMTAAMDSVHAEMSEVAEALRLILEGGAES
jgi:hypothetical protein